MNLRHIILTATIAVASTFSSKAADFKKLTSSNECQQWVDSVLSTMSLQERVGQLFCPVLEPNKGDVSRSVIKKHVVDTRVGGLLFRKGSLNEYASMINYAQSLARIPIIMTLDGEWGLAMRIPEAPVFPYNMALGAVSDTALLEEYGREVARECRETGINIDFAPVADVNLNPANPVIGRRSFGEDPERVAQAVVSFSRGMESGGVLSCAKHFPGHGDTSTDSHKTVPVVDHSREFLSNNDLLPFQRYINEELSAVMVGHLSVPVLDPSMTPASLSRPISTGLLKEEMGFSGLVFTDALEMKGAKGGSGNNCVDAFMAGADFLLSSANPATDREAILTALKNGKISEKQINERCRKILAYKWALGLNRQPAKTDLAGLKERLNTPETADLIDRLTIASITAINNQGNILPLNTDKTIAVVNLGAPAINEFSEIISRHAPIDRYSNSNAPFTAAQLSEINSHDIVITGVYSDNSTNVRELGKIKARVAVIPVMFMTPYKAMEFKSTLAESPAFIMAYDNNAPARRAAADAIFAGNAVSGKLPVSMPGIAPLGAGVDYPATRLSFSRSGGTQLAPWLVDSIDAIMNSAVTAGAFPGAQVMVVKDGRVIVDRCYGKLSTEVNASKVNPSTIYDLASLSKAVATLPGIMLAYEKGLLDIDVPIGCYIPELVGTDKARLTPRQLLFHEGGMPASLDMYKIMMDTNSYKGQLIKRKRIAPHTIKISRNAYGNANARMRNDIITRTAPSRQPIEIARGIWATDCAYDTIMGRIYTIPLKSPGYRYSCLNFCLLMDIEQRLTGYPHQSWVNDKIFAPLGAYTACYRPLEKFKASQIAATEKENFLRKQLLQGYVHDEIAAFSGGVQGNAGLFSTATDIAKYSQMLLNGGTYGGNRIFSPATVEYFTTTVSPSSHRGLGFDKPRTDDTDKSTACEEAPASLYGHTGFTGTCFWIDPENNLIYIFLSNRVNPSRDNSAWFKNKARSRVQSLIYKAL